MSATRPTLFVMTDGSGGGGVSRLDSTTQLLAETASTAGSIYGQLSDRQLYRQILEGDVETTAAMAFELADFLVAADVGTFVADAWQLYNPAHDLCRIIANFATRLARARGAQVAAFDYAVVDPPPAAAADVTLLLDDAALDRKLRAALAYGGLYDDVTDAMRGGADPLRHERLYRVDIDALPAVDATPFYESEGERRVAGGRYAEVLRYREHVVPFIDKMAEALDLRHLRQLRELRQVV